jgi:1,4-alpha-glucan branching enzyme
MDDQEIRTLGGNPSDVQRVQNGEHHDPHSVLGAHSLTLYGREGVVVRALHPDAQGAFCVLENGEEHHMHQLGKGLFAVFLVGRSLPLVYRLRFRFSNQDNWERDDPYRFLPTVGELDQFLFNKGDHRKIWEVLGAHPRTMDGVDGTSFSVWAPSAKRVSVIGDFCRWDGRLFPMRSLGSSGIWEIFIPGVGVGEFYKYELKTQQNAIRIKTDPYAQAMELPPKQASCVTRSQHTWNDAKWMEERAQQDHVHSPVLIYEVHLGSWARVTEDGYRSLSYRELAPRLVEHAKRFGYTHLELLPVAEHALYSSWGYQITGYFAPTSRYGHPDDLRFFVDYCHQHGVGVIIDWVPAHFPKDDFSLRRFDGTALYEHDDPRRGEHPDWGTLIFNYGRPEVKNFLVANALYWLKEFHIDGLRVDAVASMLYLDYSRRDGQWMANRYGGKENIEAIDFIRATNHIIREEAPGAMTIAEESTAWFGVTRPAHEGGLGFTFKWNMGWMHDTLQYYSKEPIHRRYHQDELTFSMIYEYSERFINSLSHDEVVYGKRAVFEKMPGDIWQKFANLRVLMAYQYTRPGKVLYFMGTEIAQYSEWNHDSSVDWALAHDPKRMELQTFLQELGALYHERPALWRHDSEPEGFEWIDCSDRDNSVLTYVRKDGEDHVIVILNHTPVPRDSYRIGAPVAGRYAERLNTDDARFGGSGYETQKTLDTEAVPAHGRPQSLVLRLPPLSALVLVPAPKRISTKPPPPPKRISTKPPAAAKK